MKPATRMRQRAGGLAMLVALASALPALGGSGMVVTQGAAPPCADDSTHIYVDCDNGTVTDNRSGLVWLADASCFDEMTWQEAMMAVASLGDMSAPACGGMDPAQCDCGLSDGSMPGEWRLPTMAEWKAAVVASGSDTDTCVPTILNDVGNACWDEGCYEGGTCSFHGVQAAWYWTSSPYPAERGVAWLGDLAYGWCLPYDADSLALPWPVRGGQ